MKYYVLYLLLFFFLYILENYLMLNIAVVVTYRVFILINLVESLELCNIIVSSFYFYLAYK